MTALEKGEVSCLRVIENVLTSGRVELRKTPYIIRAVFPHLYEIALQAADEDSALRFAKELTTMLIDMYGYRPEDIREEQRIYDHFSQNNHHQDDENVERIISLHSKGLL